MIKADILMVIRFYATV